MKSAKFKDSPLGPIPQDWEVKRLGDCVALVTKGTTPTSIGCEFTRSGITFIKAESIADNGSLIPSMFAYINEQTHEVLRRSQLKENDILFSIAGVLGRVGMVVKEVLPANTNQALAIIRPSIDGEVDIKFLFYCLQAEYIARAINQLQIGVAQANLSLENVKELWLSLPPLPEQQRIAEALGGVDKLIESLDEQIEKKRLIAKGVAHDLLSGKKRLPGFKGAWKTRSIEDMLTLGHGRDYKGIPNGDVPVYGTGGVMCYVAEYLYEGPTVCIGRKGTIDAPIYHDGKIWTVDTLFYSHSFKECYPKFIYYKFLTIDWQSYNEASGVPSLTADIIGRISLEVPMSVAEQQAIADLLGEQDAAIAALEAKREKYARIKEGMMRDLLTGKVRMKGE